MLALVAAVPGIALGQDDKAAAAERYVYGTYFECDTPKEWAADQAVEQVWKPVYDQAVKDGALVSWGWLAHHTGGTLRRVIYYSAASIEGVLDAQEKIRKAIADKATPLSNEFGSICGRHEDYIWKSSVGSTLDQNRGAAGFSTYWECDISEEDRADEIVKESMAPVYDRMVKEGKLVSWGWLSHVVGGEWRRLSTMTAKDVKSLMAAREAIREELMSTRKSAMEELGDICGDHQDYIWNIQLQTP